MTHQNYPHAERPGDFRDFPTLNKWLRRLHDAFQLAKDGKLDCVTDLTLTANAASTTLSHPLIAPNSWIGFHPTTANAKAEYIGATFRISSQTAGSCVVAHANNAQADRDFNVLIVGG